MTSPLAFLRRHSVPLLVGGLGLCAGIVFAGWTSPRVSVEPKILYSLDARANDKALVSLIDGAHAYIYFAIYTFTKQNIADALARAKARGILVLGIMDREQSAQAFEKPVLAELASAGIPIVTQKHLDGIMHIKALVTDTAYAIGSYNWTDSATVANDEVLEIGTDESVREQYLAIVKKVIAANTGSSGASAHATTSASTVIDYTDAPEHIGDYLSVRGTPVKIYASSKGTVFFDYCIDYKNCPFSVVIFSDDAKKFADLPAYQNRMITVTGLVKQYGSHAEIVLTDPKQVK